MYLVLRIPQNNQSDIPSPNPPFHPKPNQPTNPLLSLLFHTPQTPTTTILLLFTLSSLLNSTHSYPSLSYFPPPVVGFSNIFSQTDLSPPPTRLDPPHSTSALHAVFIDTEYRAKFWVIFCNSTGRRARRKRASGLSSELLDTQTKSSRGKPCGSTGARSRPCFTMPHAPHVL